MVSISLFILRIFILNFVQILINTWVLTKKGHLLLINRLQTTPLYIMLLFSIFSNPSYLHNIIMLWNQFEHLSIVFLADDEDKLVVHKINIFLPPQHNKVELLKLHHLFLKYSSSSSKLHIWFNSIITKFLLAWGRMLQSLLVSDSLLCII